MMLTFIEYQKTADNECSEEETEHVQSKSKRHAGHDIHVSGRRVYILQLIEFAFEDVLSAIRSDSRQTV